MIYTWHAPLRLAFSIVVVIPMLVGCRLGLTPESANRPLGFLTSKEDKAEQEANPLSDNEQRRLCIATAQRLSEAGHAHEAVELYLKAEGLKGQTQVFDRELAPLFAAAERYAESLDRYQKLIAKSPHDVELRLNYAWVLMDAGEPEKSESVLREVLRNEPSHERARNNLAVLLVKSKRYDQAFTEFSRTVGEAAAHYNLGVLLVDAGETELARHAFQSAERTGSAPEMTASFLRGLSDEKTR